MPDDSTPERQYVNFKELKARVSMRDLLDHYELTDQMEEKSPETLVGPCPITDSESQAFKVNEAKDVWYSFALEGDGGGNVLDFVARMEDTDVLGAANLIDGWFPAEEESKEDAQDESEESEGTPDLGPDRSGESARKDTRDAVLRMCGEEIALLEDKAFGEIEAALDAIEPLEEAETDVIADRLHHWIVRAYRRGYQLGKMQGAIDERISRLG